MLNSFAAPPVLILCCLLYLVSVFFFVCFLQKVMKLCYFVKNLQPHISHLNPPATVSALFIFSFALHSFILLCFSRHHPPLPLTLCPPPLSLTLPCHWQDLPRSPVAPPLDSCFLRPVRPANQRPPSRWAAHSPSSSPKWSEGSRRRFTFPPPGRRRAILEGEEPA